MLVSKSLLCIKLRSTTLLFVRPKRLWLLLIIHHSLNYSFHLFYGLWFLLFSANLKLSQTSPELPPATEGGSAVKDLPNAHSQQQVTTRSVTFSSCSCLRFLCVCVLHDDGVSVWFVSCRMCAECYIEVKYNVFLFKRSYIQYATV